MIDAGVYAVIDPPGLGSAPIFFTVKSNCTSIFVVDDFRAAAAAIQQLTQFWTTQYASRENILTQNRLIPIIDGYIKKEQRRAIKEALRQDVEMNLCVKEAVKLGIVQKRYKYPNLGHALNKKKAFLSPSPIAITQHRMRNENGTYSLMNVPAYRAKGFQKYDLRQSETVEVITSLIFTQYDKITRALVKPVVRTLPELPEKSAIAEMQRAEQCRLFVENIKFGLITATTGGLSDTADEDEKLKIAMFAWAVLRGSVPMHFEHDPLSVCKTLIEYLSVAWSATPVWRGLGHGLPILYLGYGMFNKSKKYQKVSGLPLIMQQSWRKKGLDHIITGFHSKGITVHSPRDVITQTVCERISPSPFPSCNLTEELSPIVQILDNMNELPKGIARRITSPTSD